MKENSDTEQSVALAYQFVLPSYDWMLRRLASVESRINNLLMLIATVTAGIPLVVVGLNGEAQHLNGWLAIWAFSLFALSISLGLIARAWGKIELVDPANFAEDWISRPKEEFWKWSVHYAGKHYNKNDKLISSKSRLVDVAVGIFVVEVILWAFWAHNVLQSAAV